MPAAPVARRPALAHPIPGARKSFKDRLRALGPADRVLGMLLLAGILVRLAAMFAYPPTIPSNADSRVFAQFAAGNLLGDPQHPAGYSLFLALLGLVTRQVIVFTVVQHALGVATALLLFAAVRRLVGSPWPALLPAAFVLLNADQVYQEQTISSEWLFTALLALSLYATVRAIETRERSWPWSATAGVITGLAVIARTQGMPLIPVFAFALLIAGPRPWGWRAPVALLVASAAVLFTYGVAKDAATGRFEVGPSPGWQLYAHVAPFANCRLFTPPQGTAGLCESTPPSRRAGDGHYLFDRNSPAVRLFGHLGNSDGKVRAWAFAVVEHQPGDYVRSVYDILRDYFVPGTFVYTPRGGDDIDAELDWSVKLDWLAPVTVAGMERFFDHFTPQRHRQRTRALHDYQRVFRFGATLLTLTALLTLLALAIGPRRIRVGAVLFGIGGLSTLLPEALGGAYIGRYAVPLAGPMGAAAGIALWTLWRRESERRASTRAGDARGTRRVPER